MKIKCVSNSGKDLSKRNIELGNSPGYIYEELKVNQIYIVYGMIFVKGTVEYLIEAGDSPTFVPAEFFKVVESLIPPMWHFGFFKEKTVEAMFGYKELALDEDHNVQLTLRESEKDFKIFYQRKNEIDEWEKEILNKF